MKIYSAFRLAAEKMQSVDPLNSPYWCSFICLVLEFHPEIPAKTSKKARAVIAKRLGGSYTYKGRIRDNHPELLENISVKENMIRAHQGRIAWLWSLHEEFKKKQN